jgi:hypothetical protein
MVLTVNRLFLGPFFNWKHWTMPAVAVPSLLRRDFCRFDFVSWLRFFKANVSFLRFGLWS